MTDIVQKGNALVGIAKQATAGSPAPEPWYAHALTGGKTIGVEISQDADEITSGTRTRATAIRTGVAPSLGPFTSHAYVKALGLYLLAVYGNVADGGSGPSAWTHAYSVGDFLPLLTAFSRLGSDYEQVSDVKVNELGLSWDGPNPLELSVNGPGCAMDASIAAWDLPTGHEVGSDAFFIPVGGSFKIATSGGSPAVAVVSGGEIKISNGLEPVPDSSKITPAEHSEKIIACEVTLKITPEDLDHWRTILTGDPDGSVPQEYAEYGSFELNFVEGLGGTATLKLEGSRVAFLVDFPDADPGGGGVELDLAGVCYYDDTHAPIVPTLTNSIQFYGSGVAGS